MVPDNLLDALWAARPICTWDQSGTCRSGRKCQFRHLGKKNQPDAESRARLPFTSVHSDGSIRVRPPLGDALNVYFSHSSRPGHKKSQRQQPLAKAKNFEADGTPLIEYQLHGMEMPSCSDIIAARNSGVRQQIWEDGRWTGKYAQNVNGASEKRPPQCLVHCTSIKHGFEILDTRKVLPTTGVAGRGAYTLQCDMPAEAFQKRDERHHQWPKKLKVHRGNMLNTPRAPAKRNPPSVSSTAQTSTQLSKFWTPADASRPLELLAQVLTLSNATCHWRFFKSVRRRTISGQKNGNQIRKFRISQRGEVVSSGLRVSNPPAFKFWP